MVCRVREGARQMGHAGRRRNSRPGEAVLYSAKRLLSVQLLP